MAETEPRRKNPVTVTRLADGTFQFRGTSPNIVRDKNLALEAFGYELKCYGIRLMLLPSKEQQARLNKTIGCARVIHNDYIRCRQEAYKNGICLNLSDYKKYRLPEIKAERPFLKAVEAHSLEFAAKHADAAYQNFFSGRSERPRFVSKNRPNGNRYESSFSKTGVREENGKVYATLPKIGTMKAVLPGKKPLNMLLPPGADITGATVSKEIDHYFISIHVSLPVPRRQSLLSVPASKICAVDMGVKSFAVSGVGAENPIMETFMNPKWVTKEKRKIRRFQRSLSRKKKGSKKWNKARAKLARAQKKIANQRKDYGHKLSRYLVDRCDVFVCEDLNIKGMVKNHSLAREISSAGWGIFLSKVEYKMQWKGGVFMKVGRFFPSSKTCHHCGYHYQSLSLKERKWECPQCHIIHDRDENAVHNLLNEGIRLLEEMGVSVVYEKPLPKTG